MTLTPSTDTTASKSSRRRLRTLIWYSLPGFPTTYARPSCQYTCELPSFGAVEHRQIRKPPVRDGLAGETKHRCKQHSNRFHLVSLK